MVGLWNVVGGCGEMDFIISGEILALKISIQVFLGMM